MKHKIIIILNRLVIGGQAVDTIPLAYYLQNDFDVLILYGEKEPDEEEAIFLLQQYPGLKLQKIKQLRRTINPVTDLVAFFTLLKNIHSYKPKVVHTHGSKSGLLGRLAAYISGVPVIVHTFHGHLFHSYFNSFGNKLIRWLERRMASITTFIIALSIEQQKELTSTFSIAPLNKTHVVKLGVDDSFLIKGNELNRQFFRNKFNIPANAMAIGIVGRIVPIKDHHLFLNIALELLKQKIENVYFLIIGDGTQKKELTNYLAEQQVAFSDKEHDNSSTQIIFTSWMDDMISVYHGLDIVMLTSLNEGTPLSIIEAQICGKPVIATNVGGVQDTFEDGVSGFLINNRSIYDFVEATKKLLANKDLQVSMSKRAIENASLHFSKQKEVNAMKHLYLRYIQEA